MYMTHIPVTLTLLSRSTPVALWKVPMTSLLKEKTCVLGGGVLQVVLYNVLALPESQ